MYNQLKIICNYAKKALKISDGEFWIWDGSPYILITNMKGSLKK